MLGEPLVLNDESLDEEDFKVLMQCVADSYKSIRENAWGRHHNDDYYSKLYKIGS